MVVVAAGLLAKRLAVKINLLKGRHVFNQNVQTVLNALWRIADENGIVAEPMEFLEKRVSVPHKYIKELEDFGCVKSVFSGKRIETLWLLKKQLPREKPSGISVDKKEGASCLPVVSSPSEAPAVLAPLLDYNWIRIFIDVPNVVNLGDRGVITQIDWVSFVSRIANGRFVKKAAAYVSIPSKIEDKNVLNSRIANALRGAGIQMRWRKKTENARARKTDIDQLMAFDLGRFCENTENVGNLAIVTGDDDFADAVREIRRTNRTMRIEVYCWKDHLSQKAFLWAFADRVFMLDDFQSDILPKHE